MWFLRESGDMINLSAYAKVVAQDISEHGETFQIVAVPFDPAR